MANTFGYIQIIVGTHTLLCEYPADELLAFDRNVLF